MINEEIKTIDERKFEAQEKMQTILADNPQLKEFEERIKATPAVRVTLKEKDIIVYNIAKLEKGLPELNNYTQKINLPKFYTPSGNPIMRMALENNTFIVKDGNNIMHGYSTFSPAGKNLYLLMYRFDCFFTKESFKKFVKFMASYLKKCGHKKMVIGAWERYAYIALSELNSQKISIEKVCEESSYLEKKDIEHIFKGGAIFEFDVSKISTEELNIATEEIYAD